MVVKESDYSFCSVVGKTDVGCRRSVNEDSIGKSDTQNGLAVVICDGMGGNVGGKIASETAVDAILMHLREHQYSDPKEAISNAIQEANRAILKKTELRPELTGMGCTCVLLLVGKSGAANIGHIGDSRIYLIRDGLANQLTKDQSYVQMLVDEGKLTPQEAEHHPRNNEITNAVGMVNMTPPVIRDQSINPVAGDCFLLCSDGLSKLVPEGDIVKIISARSFSTDKRAEMLINAAKNNGGTDNISVQLVEFSVTPAEVRMAKDKKRLVILSASLVLAIILLLLGLFTFKGCNKEKKVEDDITESTEKSYQSEGTKCDKKDTIKSTSTMPILTPLSGYNDAGATESETSKESPAAESQVTIGGNDNNPYPQSAEENKSSGNNDNQKSNSCAVDNVSNGVKHFPNSSERLFIPRPTLKEVNYHKDAKLTEGCCEISGPGKEELSPLIYCEEEEDGKGGLYICKKASSKDLDWTTIKMTIRFYCYKKEGKEEKEPLKNNIQIIFD